MAETSQYTNIHYKMSYRTLCDSNAAWGGMVLVMVLELAIVLVMVLATIMKDSISSGSNYQ